MQSPLELLVECWSDVAASCSLLSQFLSFTWTCVSAKSRRRYSDKITNPLIDPVALRRLNYYSRLKRLVAHMSMHPMKQISLNLAATVACMGRTAFSRFFKRSAGITFREFVQQWRTGMVVQLMLESDRGLYDVACEVGFHNLAAFERTFKKVTSFTPYISGIFEVDVDLA
jgi:AraC-like DNA-binding protein